MKHYTILKFIAPYITHLVVVRLWNGQLNFVSLWGLNSLEVVCPLSNSHFDQRHLKKGHTAYLSIVHFHILLNALWHKLVIQPFWHFLNWLLSISYGSKALEISKINVQTFQLMLLFGKHLLVSQARKDPHKARVLNFYPCLLQTSTPLLKKPQSFWVFADFFFRFWEMPPGAQVFSWVLVFSTTNVKKACTSMPIFNNFYI